jgi:hypothetical protein
MEEKIAQMIVRLYVIKNQVKAIEKQINEIQEFWESDEFLNYIKTISLSKEDFD